MSCTEYEELIYTFQELDNTDQEKVKQHLETCPKCKLLFDEVQRFSLVINKVNRENQHVTSPAQFTNKVLNAITSNNTGGKEMKVMAWFDRSISRYAFAAVSCGILVLFYAQIMVPELKSGRIQGPISNIQGAIIKSDDFRKVFTKSKEKKSLFDECKNMLSQQVDENCVKEKLDKFNF